MSYLTIDQKTIPVGPAASVLDACLEGGVAVPHSCRSGACQCCLMQAVEGTPPPESQVGLKPSFKAQGYFLACQCKPAEPLTIRLPDMAATKVAATVVGLDRLGAGIVALRLKPATPFAYRAGQYATLWRDAMLGRSYSLASLPGIDPYLEMHVKKMPGGRMSGWVHDGLAVGDRLSLQGPAGDCFYLPASADQPILMVGTGCGLAPLYGILRDALRSGHQGPIHLCHGGVTAAGLYLVDELRALAEAHPGFRYHPCVLRDDGPALPPGTVVGAVDKLALGLAGRLKGWKVYLCGAADFVQPLRRKVFLAGAAIADIHADAFL